MTKDRSVKAEIERLIAEIERKVAEWRARASVLRPKRYTGSDDAANATEQCAEELESHPEQGWQPMLQRAHDALDAADRLMARHSETFFPVERWQEWRRRHRQALCDVLPLPTPPSPLDPEK